MNNNKYWECDFVICKKKKKKSWKIAKFHSQKIKFFKSIKEKSFPFVVSVLLRKTVLPICYPLSIYDIAERGRKKLFCYQVWGNCVENPENLLIRNCDGKGEKISESPSWAYRGPANSTSSIASTSWSSKEKKPSKKRRVSELNVDKDKKLAVFSDESFFLSPRQTTFWSQRTFFEEWRKVNRDRFNYDRQPANADNDTTWNLEAESFRQTETV